MNGRLYHLASASFSALRRLGHLPPEHPAHRLHGRCFEVRIAAELAPDWGGFTGAAGDALSAALARCIEPLVEAHLNDLLPIPGDLELARWIAGSLEVPGPVEVLLHSAPDRGLLLDRGGGIRVWRRFRFEAAHRLPRVPPDHPCRRLHGHGFEVALVAGRSDTDPPAELIFERLAEVWAPLQAELHQVCLNDLPGLDNPTSEQLARWIWSRLKPVYPPLCAVQVQETATAGCRFDGRRDRIWKEQSFEAALALPQAPAGDRRRGIHGHSYRVRLALSAPLDPLLGWTIDYREVKRRFAPIYEQLDHQRLDLLPGLASADPGHLAYWIRDALLPHLPALERIDLFPTPTQGVALCWGGSDPDPLLI